MSAVADQIASFDSVDRVVADPLRFKLKLGIGEDAYTSMRVGKALATIWDVGGMAATGGGVAASGTVATAFFAPSGFMAAIGLGATAVTPVGWIIAASVMTGGAYYGVTRLFHSYSGSRVDVIPKFINTPVDALGASLLDMFGALALKIAAIDGEVAISERNAIHEYFVSEWGFDRTYVDKALSVIEDGEAKRPLKHLTTGLVKFSKSNPDCSFDALREEILTLLREVVEEDGQLDEREELALESVALSLNKANSVSSKIWLVAALPGTAIARVTGFLKRNTSDGS